MYKQGSTKECTLQPQPITVYFMDYSFNGAQNIGPLIEGIAPFDAIWVKKGP